MFFTDSLLRNIRLDAVAISLFKQMRLQIMWQQFNQKDKATSNTQRDFSAVITQLKLLPQSVFEFSTYLASQK